MSLLLALFIAVMPLSKSGAAVREVHGRIELPHRLFLGAGNAIAFERLSKDHTCSYAPVRPREFWIIECSRGQIRALGQYSIGLLQYEEYGSDASGFVGAVCGGDAGCSTKNRFILLVPGWHRCQPGIARHRRNAVAEYDAASGRLLYQEWMQWDLGIDFLSEYRKNEWWSGK
jgi:hypothetical protein